MAGNEQSISIIEYKNILTEAEKEQLFNLYNNLCLKWGILNSNAQFYHVQSFQDTWNNAIKNFNIDNDISDLEQLDMGYKTVLYEAFQLYLQFLKHQIIIPSDNDDIYFLKFNKIFEIIIYCEQLIRSKIRIDIVYSPNYESFMNDDISLYKFLPQDFTNNTPYQNLLLYLLNLLQQKGFKRYADACYLPVYNKSGQYAYAWKKSVDIEKFVFKYTQKELHFDQWKNLTSSKDNGKQVIDFLKKCDDPQFPNLIKDRHMFSFRNGLYIAKYPIYDENTDETKITDKFYLYDESHNIDKKYKNIIACKYFDLDMPPTLLSDIINWKDIQTPTLNSILEYQFNDEPDYDGIVSVMYIMIGRMLYDLNELDHWQVITFLKGMGGAGKSTIITKVVKEIYEPEDVGQLSNDGERQFALSAFYDKKIFIAPEIKTDFSLPQAVLQGIISGEDVSIPIKFKTAENIVWKTPGMMAGNEVPNFTDNSGSVSRRFLVFNFNKKVKKSNSDPLLGKKLKQELPAIIRKSNLAYLEAISIYGDKDIWPQLPKYFRETQEEMSEQTNSLVSYLNSDNIIYDKDIYCQESLFKKMFNTYCKENNLGIHKFNPDFYRGPFIDVGEKYNIKVQVLKKLRKKYPRNNYGKILHGTFIMGLDIKEEIESDDESIIYNEI